ncbi:MAG: polyhydroxybutyrate depolymerase [Pseudomonadota bacterium]
MATFPAAAQGCGDAETPCEIDGGHYHAALPADGAARGAVLFLHGWGGTGRGVIRNGGLVSGFLERGYALIAPQGMPRREGDTGGSWNSFARESRRDDVAFLDSVAADAVARFGLDRDNMAVTGFSGGGMMAWRVACDAPATFRAYGPIAGLLWRPLPESCAGPIRMQHTHGWADPVVPIEGRSVAGGRFTQGDLFRGLDILRAASGCVKDDPDSYDAAEPYLIRRWTSCAEGGEIEMALHPGGHSIPPGWSTLFLDWYEAGAVSAGGL